MSNQIPFLSIIVPIYNETKRLNNLSTIHNFLKQQKFNSEIIVVNDGSIDQTLQKIKILSKKLGFKIVSYSTNRGKGFAIKLGMIQSKGQYRLFTDLDLSTPLEELSKFYPYFKKYDILIGSRKLKGSKLINRQPIIREYLGKGFTLLSRIILGVNVSDFTCGFKCFSKQAAEEIFTRQKINRWGFDSEILFIAKVKCFKIKEIPVKWSNDEKTKVKFPDDLIRSFYELLQIRYNHFKNFYD